MGRIAFLWVLLAMGLMGCTGWGPSHPPPRTLTDEQVRALSAEVQAIGNSCKARRQSGVVRGFAASVQCSNPGILAIYQKFDYPYMGLVDLALAKRLQLAERADDKKISEGDMLVDFYSDVRSLPAMPAP